MLVILLSLTLITILRSKYCLHFIEEELWHREGL